MTVAASAQLIRAHIFVSALSFAGCASLPKGHRWGEDATRARVAFAPLPGGGEVRWQVNF
jgi:hypothetical protein